jgi:hypothetical protein
LREEEVPVFKVLRSVLIGLNLWAALPLSAGDEIPPSSALQTTKAAASTDGAPAAPSDSAPAAQTPQKPKVAMLGTRDLRLRLKVSERGAAEIVRYVLHYTLDGGREWKHEDLAPTGPDLVFHAPADGHYGFAVTAIDAVGAGSPPPAPGDPPALEAVVDTAGPSIRLIRPDRLERVAADGQVEIEWQVLDENLGASPLEVSASLEGKPWEIVWTGAPPTGRRTWSAPLLPGEVRLRLRAQDLAGNSSELVTPPVYQVSRGDPGGSRWVSAVSASRSRRVPIYYRIVRDADSGDEGLPPEELRKVQLWYRPGGLEWTAGDVDPDRRSPIEFQAPQDGTFEVLVAALDQNGNWIPSSASPGADGRPDHNIEPHARFLVDTLDPRVGLEAPGEGTWVDAGAPLSISYWAEEENPRARGVNVLSSLDGGATWTRIAEGLELATTAGKRLRGQFQCRLPSIESEKFLLKVQVTDAAGNVGEAATDAARAITIRNLRQDQNRIAEDHYRRGVLQYHSSDPAEKARSLESFRKALAYQSEHAAAHHDLAVALEAAQRRADRRPDGADEALEHYRQAHAAAPDDPRFAFSLVSALLGRAEAVTGDDQKTLRAEAEKVFQKISWSRLVESTTDDRGESQRLRQQYREWKDLYFNRIPR